MENENTNQPGFNCIGDNYNEDLSIDLTVQNNDFPSNYFDVWVDSIDVIYRIANNPVVSYGSGNGYYCRGENINLVSGDSAYWMYQGTVEGVSRVYEIQNLQEDKTINAFIMSDYGCLSDTVSKTVHASKVKARFEANMNVIEDGQRVDFTNNSTGSHYSWNFGDGSLINHETNPKHYYYGSGKYDVTLVAKDTLDCIDSLVKINYIIVESEEDTSGGDDSTVTAITNFGVKNLEIYPIPAGDKLFIDSDKMITRYELLSFEGKLIQEKAINRKRKVIHMSKLAAGIYVLNIYYGNQRITHKIIKK
jgi:PKD repeat protein